MAHKHKIPYRLDMFDYIETFYNPRVRSRLEQEKKNETRLNQSVRGIGT